MPPKFSARETPPIAPRTALEGQPAKELVVDDHAKKLHELRVEPEQSTGLARTFNAGRFATELAFAVTPQPVALDSPIPHIQMPATERGEFLETMHEANDKETELRKKRDEAEQGMKMATKEATDKMHKGEIRETPPSKPPEKPAEKATSEVSKAQAEKQRVLAPDAKVVRSTVEPPRPVHRAPGIKEVDFSPKPQETKKDGTGKDGKEDPTKHKFETPDQPKPKPTIQGPKM